jgi:hypothetical protein
MIFLTVSAYANEALWIEGEDYASTTFNQHGQISS